MGFEPTNDLCRAGLQVLTSNLVAHDLTFLILCPIRLFCQSRLERRPDSHLSDGKDGERPRHLVTVLGDHLRYGIRLACREQARQAHQQNAK